MFIYKLRLIYNEKITSIKKGASFNCSSLLQCHSSSKFEKIFFNSLNLNRLLINEMKRLDEEGVCKGIAFVLMPDHIHWLFQLKTRLKLSELIRTFKGRCSKLAREHSQINKLWQADYYDHMIRDENDLISCARYIVANPLRAGLVKNVGSYPYWDCIYIK